MTLFRCPALSARPIRNSINNPCTCSIPIPIIKSTDMVIKLSVCFIGSFLSLVPSLIIKIPKKMITKAARNPTDSIWYSNIIITAFTIPDSIANPPTTKDSIFKIRRVLSIFVIPARFLLNKCKTPPRRWKTLQGKPLRSGASTARFRYCFVPVVYQSYALV